MEIVISSEAPLSHATPALVLFCFEDGPLTGTISAVDARLDHIVSRLREEGEFTGRLNSVKIIHSFGSLSADRIVLVGLGKKNAASMDSYRQAAGSAIKQLKTVGVERFASVVDQGEESYLEPLVEGYLLGGYSFSHYKNKPDMKPSPQELTFVLQDLDKTKAERRAKEALAVAEAACYVRDLVSQPANTAIPQYLAQKAEELAKVSGITCSVLERDELEEKGMGALVAVGKGSRNAPKLVALQYQGGKTGGRPTVLVGKGVTFDSGGISLKPRDGMEKMKDDMAGAAAVLGIFKAVAALSLPVNLVGLMPLAENLPDGGAYKPGDVLKAMSGTTIEVVNTDAEGRLILCDALHFAREYNPEAIIDIATLTGACVVALGAFATGVMGTDEALIKALVEAGERTGERVWQLPLWDEYGELMESDIADMKNAGGTSGATISAAWFLKQFVGEVPWAHLDIAGTAWEDKGRPYLPKGATGVGVRLLVRFLSDRVYAGG